MDYSTRTIRILLVDDYKDWRNHVRLLLGARPGWQVVCEVADGLEAIEKTGELKPDLIVLDIGLPKLNGIEAARRIRRVAPSSKILFLTMDNNLDTQQAALNTGAEGFVHKARALSELLPAIDKVLCVEPSSSMPGVVEPSVVRPRCAAENQSAPAASASPFARTRNSASGTMNPAAPQSKHTVS